MYIGSKSWNLPGEPWESGYVQYPCATCGHAVWVTAAGIHLARMLGDATVLCAECFDVLERKRGRSVYN